MRRDGAAAVVLAAVAGLAATPFAALHAGRAWEAGNLAGLLAALGCVLLAALPVRPRIPPSPAALALIRHRDLGLAVFGLALAHVAILWWREPLLAQHLWPTAPWYMLAGLAALLALAYVAVAGLWRVRRHFRTPARFQIWHIGAGVLVLASVAAHAIGAARYLKSTPALGACVLASVVALLMQLRARRHGRRAAVATHSALARLAEDSVCPRYGVRLAVLVLLGATLTAVLLLPAAGAVLHRTGPRRTAGLALAFPHEKHREVNCVACHHNYVDHTGSQTCVECHRAPRADLKVAIEPRFHAFCEGCHEERTGAEGRRGPIRSCAACHHGTTPILGFGG